MLRLHGGERQKKHAATVATFAYQSRRRGFRVEVIPQVEGPAEPDAAVFDGDGKPVYVEVETGRRRDRKWQNMADLQGFVAVCAGNEAAQAALVEEIKSLGIPGRATCLDVLIQDKEGTGKLWAQEWEK